MVRGDLGRGGLEGECRAHRAGRVVGLVAALVEDHHHRVADDLVHDAAVLLEQRHELPEVAVQHRRHPRRGRPLREGREALQVGEQDRRLAGVRKRLVEVERAEPLLVPLAARADGDRDERGQHQQVPFPPRGVPVASPRDHEHRLGQERERESDAEQELRAAALVEAEVADCRGRIEHDPDYGQRDLPAVELLGVELARERPQLRERDRRPHCEQRRERRDQRPRPAQDALGRGRPERQSRGRREEARNREPERRRELKARVLTQQHARRGECVQAEEAGRRDEGERDQEQPRVSPPAGGDADGVAEHDAERGGSEHEPEMRGMVLPGLVDPGMHQQEREQPCAEHERSDRPRGGGACRPGLGCLAHRSSWPCGSP